MLNKISLVIKSQSGNILIAKMPRSTDWQFPYLFADHTIKNPITLILNTVGRCGVGDVKSVNYLFGDSFKLENVTSQIPILYYEILIDRHITLSPEGAYSYLRYYSPNHLDLLSSKTYDIKKYLSIIGELKKGNEKSNIFNSF